MGPDWYTKVGRQPLKLVIIFYKKKFQEGFSHHFLGKALCPHSAVDGCLLLCWVIKCKGVWKKEKTLFYFS